MTVYQRIAFIAMSLLVAASVFSTNVQAESNPIYFPYVVNDNQTSTELILTNASGTEATVTLTGYREDGSSLAQNSVRVPAASQTVVGASVFGSLQGWVLGSSNVPGVLGNVRVSSRDGSAQDTTEPGQFDTVIVLPLVAQSYGASTEISVVNPTLFNTRVNLSVYDKAGKALAENDASLSPFAMYRGTLAAVFGGDKDYSNASHVVARSIPLNIFSPVVNILGFEVVRGFARIPDDASLQKIFSRRDWAALPAVAVSAGASSLTFPHAFRLADWFCLIGLVNLTDSQQTATLTYSTATNPNAGVRSVSIPANGSIQVTVADLFGGGQDTGSIKVAGTGSLAGFLAVGTAGGAGFAAASAQSNGLTEFFFPSVDDNPPSFTGIALRNEGSSQAIVELFLISSQGATLGRKTDLLLPQQKNRSGHR